MGAISMSNTPISFREGYRGCNSDYLGFLFRVTCPVNPVKHSKSHDRENDWSITQDRACV
jgi:hypothetical protein